VVFPKPLSVGLADGVMDTWEEYNKIMTYDLLFSLDPKLHAAYGRFPTHVLKIAIILAALDWEHGNAPVIEMPHLARAIRIVETWRESVHRAISYTEPSGVEQLWTRIMKTISTKNNGTGVSLRDIVNNMRDVKTRDIQECLKGMLASGDIVYVPKPLGTRVGRQTMVYKSA
jgi:hypothetical protein